MAPTISVVISTFNEEENLPFALGSVRTWVDEIVVLDMYSDDNTVEIARSFGAKVFFHERVGFADPARAFAFQQASGDWILSLDADEMVPFPLSTELLRVASAGNADVVRIPFLSYWFGDPLMHTNVNPRKVLLPRFFRRGYLDASSAIHNCLCPVPGSRVVKLKYKPGLTVLHFAYLDSKDFIEKLDRYTDIEARQALERGERVTFLGALFKPTKEFVARYIKGGGFLDGWRGIYVTLLYTFYRIVAAAKLHELTALGGREQIETRYRQEAEEVLKAYGELPASLSNATAGASASHNRSL
ncbi:MAG: glycosyltransferase family 2 protein [Terracidiphilus sp.]